MTAPPVHVTGTAAHQKAAWALWSASIFAFLLYAFTTIYDGYEKRADPPSVFAMKTTDYNAPQVLLCPSTATGGPFVPKFHEFTMPPLPSKGGQGGSSPPSSSSSSSNSSSPSPPSSNSSSPSPPSSGGPGESKGRRRLFGGGGPPGAEKAKGAGDLLGSDGALTEAGLQLLKLPYCVITLKDDTEFPCELVEKSAGKGTKRRCLAIQSDYIGVCKQPERAAGQKPEDVVDQNTCDGDLSRDWASISVRFMFEIVRAPPLFAKEFKAFVFERPEEIKLMDQGKANTFGVPFDSYTTLTLQRMVHYVLRVGPRAEEPGEKISYSAMGSSSAIGYFPAFTGDRGENHTIALELVKNPAVTQQSITDEDPLEPLILAGTLFGAFGYVGMIFTWFFPETADESPRKFAPAWAQAVAAVAVVKGKQAVQKDGAKGGPADNQPTPTADAAAAEVAQMQGDPGETLNPMMNGPAGKSTNEV